MNTKDIFGHIEISNWLDSAVEWKQQLPWLRYSREISLELLDFLHRNKITKEEFAITFGLEKAEAENWFNGKKDFKLSELALLENFFENISQRVNPKSNSSDIP